jgi:hypothetical protein
MQFAERGEGSGEALTVLALFDQQSLLFDSP